MAELLTQRIDIDGQSQKFEIYIDTTESYTDVIWFEYPSWVNFVSTEFQSNNELQLCTFKADVNLEAARRGDIFIHLDDGYGTVFQTKVYQNPFGDEIPIFSNKIIQLDADSVEYHIDIDNKVVFAGKAYKYPDNEYLEICVNDVVKNYLKSDFPEVLNSNNKMENYFKPVTIETSDDNVFDYSFYNDWSYEGKPIGRSVILNDPIDNKIVPWQFVFSSVFCPNTTEGVDIYRFGIKDTTYSTYIGGQTYMCRPPVYMLCGETLEFCISNTDRSVSYVLDNTDKEYVLYYVNANGGWDSLVVDGNVLKTDDIQSELYRKKTYDIKSFDNTKYLNVIKPRWTLHTGYLSDKQASKMHHLLESTQVYLHHKGDSLCPVIITNSSCEYKTFTNNGKKKFYYTIEVESSKDKYRQ